MFAWLSELLAQNRYHIKAYVFLFPKQVYMNDGHHLPYGISSYACVNSLYRGVSYNVTAGKFASK